MAKETKEKKEGTTSEERTLYELGYHIVSTTTEENLGAEVTAIKDVVEMHGGIVVSDEFPKAITLAYPITKNISNKKISFKTAYFGWIKFQATRDRITAFKEALEKSGKIIRFLVVKTTHERPMPAKRMPFLRTRPSITGRREKSRIFEKKAEPAMTEEELDKTIEELIAK